MFEKNITVISYRSIPGSKVCIIHMKGIRIRSKSRISIFWPINMMVLSYVCCCYPHIWVFESLGVWCELLKMMAFMGSVVLYSLRDSAHNVTFSPIGHFRNYNVLFHQRFPPMLKYMSSKYRGVKYLGCIFGAFETGIFNSML